MFVVRNVNCWPIVGVLLLRQGAHHSHPSGRLSSHALSDQRRSIAWLCRDCAVAVGEAQAVSLRSLWRSGVCWLAVCVMGYPN